MALCEVAFLLYEMASEVLFHTFHDFLLVDVKTASALYNFFEAYFLFLFRHNCKG